MLVAFTATVESSNTTHGEVYSIQQYVITFVSLRSLKIPNRSESVNRRRTQWPNEKGQSDIQQYYIQNTTQKANYRATPNLQKTGE